MRSTEKPIPILAEMLLLVHQEAAIGQALSPNSLHQELELFIDFEALPYFFDKIS